MTKLGVATHNLDSNPQSTPKKSPKKGSNTDTLKSVMAMHDAWSSYRDKLNKNWTRDIKLYNNERVTENRYQGVSDTFVPLTFGTIETMVAAIVTGDLSTDFLPQDIYKYLKDRFTPKFDPQLGLTEDEFLAQAINEALSGGTIQDQTLEVLNALYDYFWDCDNWDERLEDLVRSGFKIGTGAWWLSWNIDKPKLETVPFPDFIFDPTARDDETSAYTGRRRLVSLKSLRSEQIIDPETGQRVKRYKIPAKVKLWSSSGDDKTDKEMKDKLLIGSTLDIDSEAIDQVELIEIVTADKSYAILNRQHVIEDAANPIKEQCELRGIPYTKFLNGIKWANYRDESLYVGRSETSTFWQEQERLNDVTNQKSDAVTRALLQQKRVDPSLKSQAKSLNVPGAVIWAQDGQIDTIPQDQVPSVAFGEENSIKNNIREVTATDQIVKGVGQDADITATEAKLQVAQSGQRIELKVKSLERGPLKELALKVLLLVRAFIEDPFIIPGQSNGGLKVQLFDPRNYNTEFQPKVKLMVDAQYKKSKERQTSLNTYELLIADPTNNLEEVKRTMLPQIVDLDKDDIERIIKQPAATPMADATQEEMMAGNAPPIPALEGAM